MLTNLASLSWWKAAGLRALRTLLVVLVPFTPALVDDPAGHLVAAASTVALAVIASLATSLANLPELGGAARPWWAAMVDRVVKTFAQTIVAGIGSGLLLSDVAWPQLAQNAAVAAIGSLFLAVIANLPESEAMPASKVVQVVGTDGSIVAGPASPLPTGTVINAGNRAA